MAKSETVGKLAEALALAQGKIRGALRDSENPFFKTRYADLASVVEAIRAPLSEHGIAYVQLTEPSDRDEVRVETMLLHTSGEWISSVLALPVTKADAQGYGSALTYARRYGLSCAVGVAPEDDDGNAAAAQAPRRPARIVAPATAPAPDGAPEDRDVLLGQIKGQADRLRLKGADRAALWTEFCGATATPETADVSALAGLLERLRSLRAS